VRSGERWTSDEAEAALPKLKNAFENISDADFERVCLLVVEALARHGVFRYAEEEC
jgi:hypothetical protein